MKGRTWPVAPEEISVSRTLSGRATVSTGMSYARDVGLHRLEAFAAGLQTQPGDANGDVERGTMRVIGDCLSQHGILRRGVGSWPDRGITGPVTDHPCRVSSLWAPPRHALRNSELGGMS
jgi:hypothetical protein